jgi:hypothetical protein
VAIVKTGTVAQFEYMNEIATVVMAMGPAFTAIQNSMASDSSTAAISEYQAQLSAMGEFYQAVQELEPMFDPRVGIDQAKCNAVLERAQAWGNAWHAFVDVVRGDGPASTEQRNLTRNIVNLVLSTAELVVRIKVSYIASQTMAAGLAASAVTEAALIEMATAFREGDADDAVAVLVYRGAAGPELAHPSQ